MFLQYGAVSLKIVKFLECTRISEYDPSGTDYLWTKWRISVEAIYSRNTPMNVPYAVSYLNLNPANLQNGPAVDFNSANISAPQTDRSLRHSLSIPRQRLILSYGSGDEGDNQTWLVSPSSAEYSCDPINGPHPIEQSVTEVRGDGSLFLVRFTIETATNDCVLSGGNQAVFLLSNRWTATISADENYYETRTFTGQAIFRADLLKKLKDKTQIDKFRPNILPPTPIRCKRFIDELTVMPDGHTYHYTIRDVEQEVMYLDQPTYAAFSSTGKARRYVSSIEANVKRSYGQAGSGQIMTTFVGEITNALNAVGNAFQAVNSNTTLTKDATAIGSLGASVGTLVAAQAGLSLALGTLGASENILPKFSETVICTVWGTKFAKRSVLQYLAFSVAFGQLTNQMQAQIVPQALFNQVTSNLIGTLIPPTLPPTGQPQNATIQSLPQTVKNATTNIFNFFIGPISGVLAKDVPTTHQVTLDYDVFKKRISVIVSQEYSGLMDYCLGRQALGRKSITNPLPDDAKGGQWPAFFTTNTSVLSSVGAIGTIKGILAGFAGNPVPLDDAESLIGYSGVAPAGLGPSGDNNVNTGSLLQLIAADFTQVCQVPIQPLTNITGISTSELMTRPLSLFDIPAFSPTTSPGSQLLGGT